MSPACFEVGFAANIPSWHQCVEETRPSLDFNQDLSTQVYTVDTGHICDRIDSSGRGLNRRVDGWMVVGESLKGRAPIMT